MGASVETDSEGMFDQTHSDGLQEEVISDSRSEGAIRPERHDESLRRRGRTAVRPVVRSHYLVERLFDTPEHNLFNHVKFNLVADELRRRFGHRRPRVFDVGCGLQVARRYLHHLAGPFPYFGVDYEAAFSPDAVVDLNRSGSLDEPMRFRPDVVMMLDVLEHLHADETRLREVVGHIARAMPADAIGLVTLPQMYRLDCLKLAHLHYPEHKIRLTQAEWRAVLETHFTVERAQGVGFLSVIPYLPMWSRRYRPDNRLGRLFTHLRSKTFEAAWIKPVDLFLSRTLGRLAPCRRVANDVLFVVRKKA